MPFVETFGGELIFPSQTSYLAITTSVDVTLQWPIEQQIAGIDVVADFMDITADAPGVNIILPDARQASTGQKVLFNNVGANNFFVQDNDLNTLQTIPIGTQWVFTLTDNTTQAGTWINFQMGSSISVSGAGALTGAGIKAIAATLNQMIESDVEASTPFTVVDADRAKCLIYTTGTGTANLPSPGAVGDDWFFMLRNSGTGTLNIVPPSGVIDGAASINLDPNDSCFIFTDGTDFFTVGLSTGSVIAFDFVSLDVAGAGDFTLSGANLNRIAYRLTGLLTAIRKVVVPGTTQQYWMDNQTTGAFQLSVGTAAQTPGPILTQGLAEILYCDGVDVINAVSAVSVSFPVTIAEGGTGATTVGGAQTSLQVPPVSRDMIAGVAMSGGGDLSADRTFDFAGSLNDLSDVQITGPVTGSVLFKSAGDWLDTDAIEIDVGGDVLVRNNTVLVATFGAAGFTYDIQEDVDHFLRVLNNQGGVALLISDAGGRGRISQLSNVGVVEDDWITMARGGSLTFLNAGLDAARTTTPGAGGFVANNTLTGAGFERVLTTGDLVAIATFETAEQAITAFTTIDTAHSLGGIPDQVFAIYRCKIANNGYSVGDEVLVDSAGDGSGAQILTVGADVTNVFGKIANVASSDQPQILALATDTIFAPADGDWKWLVRAVRFS